MHAVPSTRGTQALGGWNPMPGGQNRSDAPATKPCSLSGNLLLLLVTDSVRQLEDVCKNPINHPRADRLTPGQIGRAMRSTDEASIVSSTLQDLREVPLAEMPALRPATLDQALQRILPGSSTAPVPVAAFNSAI